NIFTIQYSLWYQSPYDVVSSVYKDASYTTTASPHWYVVKMHRAYVPMWYLTAGVLTALFMFGYLIYRYKTIGKEKPKIEIINS
ncbi:MAG: hypothetical protein FWD32_02390, partial [Firmicutes bacterium]|nr:hypothetical protein [Bacillota bacterium]